MSEKALGQAVRGSTSSLLILPALLVMGLFFVLPYLNLLFMSFMTPSPGTTYIREFTLDNYTQAIEDPFNWRIINRTIRFGVITTAVTLLLSYPLAYHLARAQSKYKSVLVVMVLSPLLVGLVIRSFGWMIILADNGLINQLADLLGMGPYRLMYNQTGVLIGLIHVYMPFMVLSLLGTIQAIDPDVERAARSLGASGWSAFWRVTWPLSLPGVTAGTILVFVLAISSYVIPSLLGGYRVLTVPLLVVQMVQDLFNWPGGSALAIVFFVISIFIVFVFQKAMDRVMKGLK
jgi:putative spermidine/putrescine transport system permease protein